MWFKRVLPHLVIWPPLAVSVFYVVSYTLWTTWLSFTDSQQFASNNWVGWRNYASIIGQSKVHTAYTNLLIYGFGFVVLTSLIGLLLAVLVDQRIKAENLFRSIFLYPMALSFIVTGTVWSWILNPGLGIQKLVRNLGWTDFQFNWIVDRDMAIYTIIIVAAWQASGFAMALFLAGLRSVDADIVKAAEIDGASAARTYVSVIFPCMAPMFVTVFVLLLQFAIKTFDLVWVLTAGGPGIATALPTLVVYDYMFERGQLGRGSAAAVLMLSTLLLVVVPYWLWRRRRATA
ncbi:sugar ABC transporter permease [Bosea caraganae]|uniref:Sugar ABC transporter permease n=1 Tax=Bosea caraganae TaxID=2763117 RepID=A0A370L2C0_9HYPH|nr:sugar ABC transporter permease [Bosea caraganae]RDJ22258.1 sugar ABC transporter permease [Bosea caraganae]RDJ22655.1 sugar ABC transporter permease [Bosea caraganae]